MALRLRRVLPISMLLLAFATSARAQEVESPDGTIEVRLRLEAGVPSYEVSLAARPVLGRSPLGLLTSLGSFAGGLEAAGSERRRIDERYTLPHGKVRDVHYQANELTAAFTNDRGHEMRIIFRVSNRDVAFAYRIASRERRRITIEREQTGFRLPADATAFLTPQVPAGTGWMASKPSYEEAYLMDAPVGTAAPSRLGFTFPALFRLADRGWVLVSETGVSSRYAGTRLGEPTSDGLYTIAFPEPGENGGGADATVTASLPLLTPWRTLTIGSTLAPIVESTVATDVVEPLYPPAADYRPGRAAWSWLLWQDASMNEADQRTFLDLAARMGYEYILVDALWDERIGRERMAGFVADARARDVGVFLWYNSNGAWNDAPQSPRDCMDSAPARRREMAWLQAIGVKGLKVDFFGGDKQATMKLYEDILVDADAHGLMLNFHGATLPRGWERMYPNHMTSEAVTASENLVFSQEFADREAFNSTVFPFVRNPVAAMDYGPVVLNRVLSREQKTGSRRRTSDAFQLATAVLFQSPIQHLGLTPNNLDEQPAFVVEFLRRVPAAWDETRFVAGYPDRFAVLARRSGERWYVAATNGEAEAKSLQLHAAFLAGQRLTLIHDGPDGAAAMSSITVGADGRFELRLETGGGAVLSQ